MERTKVQYVCQTCGHASPKWLGRCPSCGEWNTLVEEIEATVKPAARRRAAGAAAVEPVSVAAVTLPDETRTPTGRSGTQPCARRVSGAFLMKHSALLPRTGSLTFWGFLIE